MKDIILIATGVIAVAVAGVIFMPSLPDVPGTSATPMLNASVEPARHQLPQ